LSHGYLNFKQPISHCYASFSVDITLRVLFSPPESISLSIHHAMLEFSPFRICWTCDGMRLSKWQRICHVSWFAEPRMPDNFYTQWVHDDDV